MQKLAVVYFPQNNMEVINSFRKKYDPNFGIIPPHITFIFPITGITENQLILHVKNTVKRTKPISIHLNGLLKTDDKLLFLLIKEGSERIISLHDELYSGMMIPYISKAYRFIPHITIGDLKENDINKYSEAEKANFDIKCILDELSVIRENKNKPVEIISKIRLQS